MRNIHMSSKLSVTEFSTTMNFWLNDQMINFQTQIGGLD